MQIDPADTDAQSLARVLLSAVVPRPIGWISSRSGSGIDNLAPYSFFNAVSSSPPVLMFSAGSTDDGLIDTPRNVLETGEFVWNLVTQRVAEAMDACGARLEPDRTEFEYADVDRAESVVVDPVRVANSPISFECELFDSLQVHDNTVIFGEVVYMHVDDELYSDGALDPLKIDAVGRLGGPYYTATNLVELQRGN